MNLRLDFDLGFGIFLLTEVLLFAFSDLLLKST